MLVAFEGYTTEAGAALGLAPSWGAGIEAPAAWHTRRIRYNPKHAPTFVVADTGAPIHAMPSAICDDTSGAPLVFTLEA